MRFGRVYPGYSEGTVYEIVGGGSSGGCGRLVGVFDAGNFAASWRQAAPLFKSQERCCRLESPASDGALAVW
jgi:hypothetical protein